MQSTEKVLNAIRDVGSTAFVPGLLAAIFGPMVLFGVGCSGQARSVAEGKTNEDGHLIFYEWDTGSQKRHAVLKNGYGMMIFYDAYQKDAVPRFELYVHEDHSVVRTKSLARFKKELSAIPAGQTLHYYNTCAGGTHHALDGRFLDEIKTYCRQKQILFQEGDDELFVICTCL